MDYTSQLNDTLTLKCGRVIKNVICFDSVSIKFIVNQYNKV